MYYGFHKQLFNKDELDRMSEENRIALAKSNGDTYETVTFNDGDFLGKSHYQDRYYIYETTPEAFNGNNGDTYVVSYSEYSNDGIVHLTHLFKSKEDALADKERLEKYAIDSWKDLCLFDKCDDEKDLNWYVETNDEDEFYICDYNHRDPFYARVTVNKQIIR